MAQISDLLDMIHMTIVKKKGENDVILEEVQSIENKIKSKELEDYSVMENSFFRSAVNRCYQEIFGDLHKTKAVLRTQFVSFGEFIAMGGEIEKGMDVYNESGNCVGQFKRSDPKSGTYIIQASNKTFSLLDSLMFFKVKCRVSID